MKFYYARLIQTTGTLASKCTTRASIDPYGARVCKFAPKGGYDTKNFIRAQQAAPLRI